MTKPRPCSVVKHEVVCIDRSVYSSPVTVHVCRKTVQTVGLNVLSIP